MARPGAETPAETVLDEIARLGFAGTQHGRGYPEGDVLREALARRGLRFAELYSALDANEDGLAPRAADIARRDLGRLIAGGGEVLVVAIDVGGQRDRWAGRVADGAPRWREAAFDVLAELLGELAAAAPDGVRVAFHPHAGTWVEDPEEVAALAERLPGTGAGLCLDVGHCLVGGGDPVDAIRRYGSLIAHVHAKDVDPAVLARLRAGELTGLGGAVRERNLHRARQRHARPRRRAPRAGPHRLAGWLMVEQDSSWLHPSEAAAIGLRVSTSAPRRGSGGGMRVAVVGAGSMGGMHASLLAGMADVDDSSSSTPIRRVRPGRGSHRREGRDVRGGARRHRCGHHRHAAGAARSRGRGGDRGRAARPVREAADQHLSSSIELDRRIEARARTSRSDSSGATTPAS